MQRQVQDGVLGAGQLICKSHKEGNGILDGEDPHTDLGSGHIYRAAEART